MLSPNVPCFLFFELAWYTLQKRPKRCNVCECSDLVSTVELLPMLTCYSHTVCCPPVKQPKRKAHGSRAALIRDDGGGVLNQWTGRRRSANDDHALPVSFPRPASPLRFKTALKLCASHLQPQCTPIGSKKFCFY